MTSSSSPLLSAEHRAWKYWFEDGLPTLVTGIGCIVGAVFFHLGDSGQARPLTWLVFLVFMALYGAIILFGAQLIEWLKTQITYPRTGYTRPPYLAAAADHLSMRGTERNPEMERLQGYRKQRLLLTCAVVGVGGFAMMYVQSRWICALSSVLMGLAFWLWGGKVYRLSWLVIASFPLMGFVVAFVVPGGAPGFRRIIDFTFGVGLLLVVDGALTLVRYLRANPAPSREP